ncbi:MAG: exodeoxyribonuclease VII small subunit [Candidatus Latescibacterota bacterium]
MAKPKKTNFEDSIKRLEMIVEELEKGEFTLEQSLDKFEEGMALGKVCRAFLDDAEARIRTIVEGSDGQIKQKDVSDEF